MSKCPGLGVVFTAPGQSLVVASPSVEFGLEPVYGIALAWLLICCRSKPPEGRQATLSGRSASRADLQLFKQHPNCCGGSHCDRAGS